MTKSKQSFSAMVGDYPITRALKRGAVTSPTIELHFADVALPQKAFKRVVRNLEFDVAELAIVTFLMAKARGIALSLLPVTITARFQHPYLVYNPAVGQLSPKDLEGRRIAIRSYTVTTVTWLRGMLAYDYGVDVDRIKWVTFEDAHVAGFSDPKGVERAAPGTDMMDLLRAGEVDAAILGAPLGSPEFATLFPDPVLASRQWHNEHQAIQINHIMVVQDAIAHSNPKAVKEIYRMLLDSKEASSAGGRQTRDMNPFGLSKNRKNLEIAVEYVYKLGLIPFQYSVDDLVHEALRDL
ncbi:MAG: hypothetical protein ACR2PG_02650 [Hyphomicrobiaceae bacterium]